MLTDSDIEALLGKIIIRADVLLTTPAAVAAPGFYADVWAKAKAVAIDEASCMSRADLCSAWGNILRILVLTGDTLQLRPTVMEPLSRFKGDAKISALGFFAGVRHPRLPTTDAAANVHRHVRLGQGPGIQGPSQIQVRSAFRPQRADT